MHNPFRYCGEYYDEETGLIYLRNRYYDSSIGRFITEDPAKDGLNWYSYCGGNPVMFVDPWGLWDPPEGSILSPGVQAYMDRLELDLDGADAEERQEIEKQQMLLYANYIVGNTEEIVYDTPLYLQGDTNLCWAYSNIMYYETGKSQKISQEQADFFAYILAMERASKRDNPLDWNKSGPVDGQDILLSQNGEITENVIFDALKTFPLFAQDYQHVKVIIGMVKVKGMDTFIIMNDSGVGVTGELYKRVEAGIKAIETPNPNPNPLFTPEGAAEILNVPVSFMRNMFSVYE